MKKKSFINQKGFSLAEMMVVILIVSIILAAAAPIITKKATSSSGASNAMPVGGIIMWSGKVADIDKIEPKGSWHLCDGNNGTPNLSNKFVVGAINDTSKGNFSAGYRQADGKEVGSTGNYGIGDHG